MTPPSVLAASRLAAARPAFMSPASHRETTGSVIPMSTVGTRSSATASRVRIASEPAERAYTASTAAASVGNKSA